MKRYALIVGVGDYQYLPKLAKPKNDARAMRALLESHGDFDEVHSLRGVRAKRTQLEEKLRYVLLEQGNKSEVLLYFSGHGFTAGPSKYEKQGYLAAFDCRVKEDSAGDLVQVEDAVSFAFLNGLIGEANLAGLAVFLDCCQSEFLIEQSLI